MRVEKSYMTIIQNRQEQNPLVFPNVQVEIGMLAAGGYSLKGFENQITIERKTLTELLISLSIEHECFMREVQQLLQYEHRVLLIVSSLSALNANNWWCEIQPRSVVRNLLRLSTGGLHVVWAENRQMATRIIEGLLFQFLRKKAGEAERIKPFISMN